MFGISYESWKEICDMYFSLHTGTQKAYLQWFPFSKLSEEDKAEISEEDFYNKYIQTGGFVLFPEVMRHSENYIQKSDGSFRNAALISPMLFLVLQAIGKEITSRYTQQRPVDIGVYYAGNYEFMRPKYKQDYDDFYKAINAGAEEYQYFIKTDITSFFGNINVNELVDRINTVCNDGTTVIPQTQLLMIKELLLYCGDGYFPLIENSMASSYLATVVYLDDIDCELHDFIETKVDDIASFQMIRYVDDLYILFSSGKTIDQLIPAYNAVRNGYSSILKKHGLALNTKKCALREIADINEELKKSQYDEYVNGVEFDIGEFFTGALEGFLGAIYAQICSTGLTNEKYLKLIDEHFTFTGIEFTPDEVFNYLVYENQTELKQPEVSRLLVRIINQDISFLSIDPKRLSVMVMQSGNDSAVRAMLNQLFIRSRAGLWNSYDTTIAIAYLIQSKFQHIDLLNVVHEHSPGLYAYYYYGCKTSFVCQIRKEKWNRYLRCISNDRKAAFLYFMSLCEKNRANILGAYAYYKNFFDRISADMAYMAGKDPNSKKPNYKAYYKEGSFKALYGGIADCDAIIEQAHKLRNANPLSHSSADLIDRESSSKDMLEAQEKLDGLIYQYAVMKRL
ncbi:MAG: AbiA family abortive infection protein [Clostridia bacterium]|nr:AbiA family abortive infection protein [Clostridia bacterium]